MKMNKEVLTFTKVFIFINLCFSLYAVFFQNLLWLLNLQVAFISSLVIILASFFSYRKNIQSNLENSYYAKKSGEERDKLDEIDDPYDLYSKDEEITQEELSDEKIKKLIKEEKNRVKQNYFKNTIFSASGFLSIYRISAYFLLILGFFALNNNGLFIPLAYIFGLGIIPIGVLVSRIYSM